MRDAERRFLHGPTERVYADTALSRRLNEGRLHPLEILATPAAGLVSGAVAGLGAFAVFGALALVFFRLAAFFVDLEVAFYAGASAALLVEAAAGAWLAMRMTPARQRADALGGEVAHPAAVAILSRVAPWSHRRAAGYAHAESEGDLVLWHLYAPLQAPWAILEVDLYSGAERLVVRTRLSVDGVERSTSRRVWRRQHGQWRDDAGSRVAGAEQIASQAGDAVGQVLVAALGRPGGAAPPPASPLRLAPRTEAPHGSGPSTPELALDLTLPSSAPRVGLLRLLRWAGALTLAAACGATGALWVNLGALAMFGAWSLKAPWVPVLAAAPILAGFATTVIVMWRRAPSPPRWRAAVAPASGAQRLTLEGGTLTVDGVSIDLERPFSLEISHAPGEDPETRATVELGQQGRRLRLAVPVHREPGVEAVAPRLTTHAPLVPTAPFAGVLWPVLRTHALAHGGSLVLDFHGDS